MNPDWLRIEKEVRAKIAALENANQNTLNNSWAKIFSVGDVRSLLDMLDYIRNWIGSGDHWSTKAEIHYLSCQSQDCAFAPCVDRRNSSAKVLVFKKKTPPNKPEDPPPSIA